MLRSRLFWFVAAIVVLCVGLMVFSAYTGRQSALSRGIGAVVVPAQGAASGLLDGVSGFFGYFYRYASLVEENEQLKAQLDEYRSLEQEYLTAVTENTELRKLTGLVAKYSDFDFELCQVSSVYRGVAQAGMNISRGSASGIEQGDVVMSRGGMIGYVSDVGPNYSEVVTVLDVSFECEAKVVRTKETVIARGSYDLLSRGKFELAFLDKEADLKVGDLVETSGYAGVYPPGLILGRVEEITLDAGGLTRNAVVAPIDDIFDMKWVYVVKDFEVVQ